MSQPSTPRGTWRKTRLLVDWIYRCLLHAYPQPFRHTYGSLMAQTFRDSCHDRLQKGGLAGLLLYCLFAFYDLAYNAFFESIENMKRRTTMDHQGFSPRHWIALGTIIVTFVVALLASINLYLLEDNSKLTDAAYSAFWLLRWSYDGVYLSALVAGVALCSIVVYATVRSNIFAGVILIFIACFVAVGGFGGLLIRHPNTFLALFVAFTVLALVSFISGRIIATRLHIRLNRRVASILGACVSVGVELLINIVSLVVHTTILDRVNHGLYTQGQIGSFNTLLVAMQLELVVFFICVLWLGFILVAPARS